MRPTFLVIPMLASLAAAAPVAGEGFTQPTTPLWRLDDAADVAPPHPVDPSLIAGTGWIGGRVWMSLHGRIGPTEWRGLAAACELSAVQWKASLKHLDLLRTDRDGADPWFADLELHVQPSDEAFGRARDRFAAVRRAHHERRMAGAATFFALVHDAGLAPGQADRLEIARRATMRRLRLTHALPETPGLEEDPDWFFVTSHGNTPVLDEATLELIDLRLADWRDEADRLAAAIDAASERWLAADRSFGRDIVVHGRVDPDAASGLQAVLDDVFVLHDRWIDHRRAWFDRVGDLVADDLLAFIEAKTFVGEERIVVELRPERLRGPLHAVGGAGVLGDLAAAWQERLRPLDDGFARLVRADRLRRTLSQRAALVTSIEIGELREARRNAGDAYLADVERSAAAIVEEARRMATAGGSAITGEDAETLRAVADAVAVEVEAMRAAWARCATRH